jgi:hypothetical protein
MRRLACISSDAAAAEEQHHHASDRGDARERGHQPAARQMRLGQQQRDRRGDQDDAQSGHDMSAELATVIV